MQLPGAPGLATILNALATPGAAREIAALDGAGSLSAVIPELDEGRGYVQPPLHHYTVLEHNIAAVAAFDDALYGPGAGELRAAVAGMDLDAAFDASVDGIPLLTLSRLACLLHDVAKPRTATITEGRLRFPRHGAEGAVVAAARLEALGLPAAATDLVARLVRQHLRPAELIRNRPPTERAVRRFAADVGGRVIPLMLLNLADGWATRGPGYTRENFRRHCSFVNYVASICAPYLAADGALPEDDPGPPAGSGSS